MGRYETEGLRKKLMGWGEKGRKREGKGRKGRGKTEKGVRVKGR